MSDGAWRPQPGPQTAALKKAWVGELFFGGARGGGKSDFYSGTLLRTSRPSMDLPGTEFFSAKRLSRPRN